MAWPLYYAAVYFIFVWKRHESPTHAFISYPKGYFSLACCKNGFRICYCQKSPEHSAAIIYR